ncbi:MAG: glycosyltransferase family 2 protein [Anaerolineales bacterium]|nr:glycosyltransferase family 2 protein [Anaerolineales bacterium]
MPVVSVIIPFCNRIAWLQEAIESVLSQTYTDYELILIDDGSSEDLSCLTKYLHLKNVFLHRQMNQGPAAARNFGIQQAKGSYIAFLDSDDQFTTDKLMKQVQLMDENTDVLLSHTSYQRVGSCASGQDVIHSGLFAGALFPMIYNACPIATPTVMVRRRVFDQGLKFCQELRIAEDVLLWAEIARITFVLGIDEPLTLVRMHGQNSATDYRAQIIGEKNIIKYGLLQNKYIERQPRRKMISIKYFNIAAYHFHYGNYKETARSLLLSLIYHPVNAIEMILSHFKS